MRLEESAFRHEYSRLVALLVRRIGLHHLETVEDAVQSALLTALETWKGSRPENATAWLFRVAHNRAVDELRRSKLRDKIRDQLLRDQEAALLGFDQPELLSRAAGDDLLQMLFVCCEPSIPVESQLVLALKTLCGFDIDEIAERLFTTRANVYKRLSRARARLREVPLGPMEFIPEEIVARLPAVQSVLYLLFSEGYLSASAPAIRAELCDEAKRLTLLLAQHPLGARPDTAALLALMYLHTARIHGRHSTAAGLILLEEQDRARWDQSQIQIGLAWLAESAHGDIFSRYHAEAGIAAEHCLARSFEETKWERVVECYELLERVAPSALHRLNRAVAVAQWLGAEKGLAVLREEEPPPWLKGSYMWTAVLADLHRRCGQDGLAGCYRQRAIADAPSDAVRKLLTRRLQVRADYPDD